MHPRLKSGHEQGHFRIRILVFYCHASRRNKRARIKRKGTRLSIHPEGIHVFGIDWPISPPWSSLLAGCTCEVHLCIFMRYQWLSNELEAGAPNHVQCIRGVIFNVCITIWETANSIVLCKFFFLKKENSFTFLNYLVRILYFLWMRESYKEICSGTLS